MDNFQRCQPGSTPTVTASRWDTGTLKATRRCSSSFCSRLTTDSTTTSRRSTWTAWGCKLQDRVRGNQARRQQLRPHLQRQCHRASNLLWSTLQCLSTLKGCDKQEKRKTLTNTQTIVQSSYPKQNIKKQQSLKSRRFGTLNDKQRNTLGSTKGTFVSNPRARFLSFFLFFFLDFFFFRFGFKIDSEFESREGTILYLPVVRPAYVARVHLFDNALLYFLA